MASIYDDLYNAQFSQPKAETGDFTRGLKQSGRQLLGTGYGVVGLGGALTGWDAAKEWGLENAQEQFDKADELGAPTDSVENIESLSDAGRFLKRGIGYVAGQAIPSIVTGGVGSIIGKKLVQEGVKTAARQGLERYAATNMMAPAEKAALEQVAKAQTRGALVGSGLASYGQEAGSIYPEQIKEGYDEPWRAAAFAVPAAALDVLPEVGAVGKLFGSKVPKVLPPGTEGPGLLRRVGTGALTQAAKEAPTEAGQSVFERMGSHQALTGPEAYSDYINSAVLGALGGGMFGAATSVRPQKPIDLSNIKEPADLLQKPAAPQVSLVTRPEPMTAERLARYLQITEPLGEKEHAKRSADLAAAFNGPLMRTINVPTGEVDENGQPIYTTKEVPWAMKTVQVPVLGPDGKPLLGPDGQPVLTSQEVPVTAGDFIANHPALTAPVGQGTDLATDEQKWLAAMAPVLDLQRQKSAAAAAQARAELLRNDEAAALRATMGLHRIPPLLDLGVAPTPPFQYDPTVQGQRAPETPTPWFLTGQQRLTPQPLVIPGAAAPNPNAQIATPGPSLRDVYAAALVKQQRGELLAPFERYLVENAPPAAQPLAVEARNTQPARQGELFGNAPLRQPNAPLADNEPSVASTGNSLNLSLFDTQGNPTYGADQSDVNWAESVRQIWQQKKARSAMIDKITAQPTPDAAAAFIRDSINSPKIASSTVDAMDAAHRILTGRTIDEWETENAAKQKPAEDAASQPPPAGEGVPPAGGQGREAPAGVAPEDVGNNPDGGASAPADQNGEIGPDLGAQADAAYAELMQVTAAAEAVSEQIDALATTSGRAPRGAKGQKLQTLKAELEQLNARKKELAAKIERLANENARRLDATDTTNNLTSGKDVTQGTDEGTDESPVDLGERTRREYEEAYWVRGMPKWEEFSDIHQQMLEGALAENQLSGAYVDEIVRLHDREQQNKKPKKGRKGRQGADTEAEENEYGDLSRSITARRGVVNDIQREIDGIKAQIERAYQALGRVAETGTSTELTAALDKINELKQQLANAEARLAARQQGVSHQNAMLAAFRAGDYKEALRLAYAEGKLGGEHLLILDALVRGNPKQVLQAIISAGDKVSAPLRKLASAMLKLDILPNIGLAEDDEGVNGGYTHTTDTVRIRDKYAFDENATDPRGSLNLAKTILHELVHAATVKTLSKAWRVYQTLGKHGGLTNQADIEFSKTKEYNNAVKLFALFDYLRDGVRTGKFQLRNARGDVMYGLKNPLEFAAEVMSNAEFQQALAGIKYRTPAGRVISALKEFVEAVANMLGLTHLKDTALAAAIEYTSNVVEDRSTSTATVDEANDVKRLVSDETAGNIDMKRKYNPGYDKARNNGSVDEMEMEEGLAALRAPAPATPQGVLTKLGAAIAGVGIDGWGMVRRTAKALMMLNQLEETFGKRLPSITAYRDAVKAKGARVRQIIDSAVAVSDLWSKLTPEERQLQSTLQAQATLAEVHPDKAFTHAANAHLTVEGDPVATARNREIWAKLSDVYRNRLNDRGRALYQAELKWNEAQRTEQERVLNEVIAAEWNEQIAAAQAGGKAEEVQKLTTERDKLVKDTQRRLARIKGPYFPLTREGNFIVVGRSDEYKRAEALFEAAKNAADKVRQERVADTAEAKDEHQARLDATNKVLTQHRKQVAELKQDGKHYHVKHFVSEAQAKRHANLLRTDGMDARTWPKTEWTQQMVGLDPRVINQIRAGLIKKLGSEQGNRVGDAMNRLLLEALPERSLRKLDIQRLGVSGYEEDMGVSFERHVGRTAHGIANLANAQAINDALTAMREEAKTSTEENDAEVYNTILNGHAASMQFKETPLQDLAVNMNYVFQLAWAPAFMLQQVLQNPMITVPSLSGKFGMAKSSNAWFKAAGEVVKMMHTSIDGGTIKTRFDYANLARNDEERALFKRFHERNQLDTTINHEMDTNDGGLKARKVMAWAGYPAAWSETVNRASAILAAYRLARGNRMTVEEATRYAEKVVADTHIDYSPENASYAMRPGVVPLSKIVFQFKKFQLGMLYLLGKNFRDAVKGESPELRGEARKVLFNTLAMQQLMAGAMGFPLAAPIGFLANMIAKLWPDDDRPDPEVWFRNLLADAFGPTIGRAVAEGLPNLLGVNLSQTLGMGNVMSLAPYVRNRDTARDTLNEYLLSFFGPTGSKVADTMEAYDLFNEGQLLKGVEKLTPRVVTAMLKSTRFATEGVTTRKGSTVIQPEELSGLQLLAQGAGFQLSEISDMYTAKNYVETYAKARDSVRSRLIDEALKAPNDADVRSDINAFNERHPEARITGSSIAKARTASRNYQRQLNSAHVRISKRERRLEDDLRFAQ